MPAETGTLEPQVDEQLAKLQELGLVSPEGTITPRGVFEANLSEFDLSPGEADSYRELYGQGLIRNDFSETESGRLHFMDLDTALHEGRDTFYAWHRQGGWDRHTADRPEGVKGFLGAVKDAAESLATKTIPEAVGGGGIWMASSYGLPKLFGWVSRQWWGKNLPGMHTFQQLDEQGVDPNELQEKFDNLAAGTSGAFFREAGRNLALMDLGNALVWAKANTLATGDDGPEIMALYEFEKGMAEFDQTSSADASAATAAFLEGLTARSDLDEKGEDALLEKTLQRAQRARDVTEQAREAVGDEELLQETEQKQASLGEVAGVDAPIGGFASLMARAPARATIVGMGRGTLKRLTKINDEILEKTVMRETAERTLRDANASELLDRTGVDRSVLRKSVSELTAEIDELTAAAQKVVERSFKGGKGGAVRDSIRDFSSGAAAWAGGTRVGSGLSTVGSKIDDFFTSPKAQWGAAAALGTGYTAYGALSGTSTAMEKVGADPGFLREFGSGLGKGLMYAAAVPSAYRMARTLTRTTHAMGAEFVARRTTQPYWQKVGERMADNKFIAGASVGLDFGAKLTTPLRNIGAAAARATAAEMPFSFIAAGGQPGWFAEAVAEGLVFGVPGQVQGLIHGLGGMPAVMKREHFNQLALNDAAELRRFLPKRHQEAFDQLDPSVRRVVGVYSAMFPDLDFRFQAAPGGVTGSGYDKYHNTVYIDPNSKRPFDALIAHEIAHGVHDRGFSNLIIDELVGPEGLLRNEDGTLTTDAQKFKADYERDLGRPIDDERLALEWFAESAAPGLMRTQALQKLVRRNPWTRSLAEAALPMIPFGKRLLLRSGILLDKNGRPVSGQGSMGAVLQGSPAMAAIIDRYLREVAGQKRPDIVEKVLSESADQPLTKEERDYAERRNKIDFELNDDGTQKKVNGRRVRASSKDLRLKRITLGEEIEAYAEELSFADPARMPEKMTLVDKIRMFNGDNWIELFDRLEKTGIYNPSQLAMFRDIFKRRAEGNKGAQMFDYQPAIKTSAGGRRKRYEPRAAERIIGAIYEVKVTKDKNVILNIIDMDYLEQRAMRASQTKLGQQLYPGGTADVMRDVMQLAENHVDGVDNAAFFKDPKRRDFLNGVLGRLSREHKSNNPLASGRPAVRSLRLDRINKAESTTEKGLPFIPESWKQNLMPEPADATTPETDAQAEERSLQERGSAPEPAGERGDTTISRGASSQRAREARQVLAGVQATAERHRFGFAVDVKSPEFYNDPGNTIYRSGDAGAAVTADGDLVSVYSVPGGEGNIDAVLTEASNDADTLDAFDIGGFLPNLYNRYGFRVVARVPFNREYAPPGWDYESAGEPDVVLAVKDPSAGPVDYNEARESVPAFAEWDDAEAHREKILSEIRESRGDDIRRMPEQLDADHRAAVETGDTETAQRMVDEAALLPREVFYLGDAEVIRNPTVADRRKISAEIRSKFPMARDDGTGYFTTRFTEDSRGNHWIWKAHEGMHSFIEPKIKAKEGVKVGQNQFVDTRRTLPATYDDQGNLIPLSERFNPESDDIRRMPEQLDDPTALPIVEARNKDGSVKRDKKGKVIYETIDYDLLSAPALAALETTPQDTTKPDYASLHYNVTRKDRARIDELIDNGSVEGAAADLESDARQAMLDAEIAAGIGWYSRMRKKLKIALAGDHQLFADLLGATSANTDVESNFIYAFDAYRQFKTGRFDSKLARFQEAVDLADTGKLKETMVKRRIVGKRQSQRMDQQELLQKWIERYNLEPRRINGKRYGMNSAHVFRALSGNFTRVRGKRAKDKLSPKTPQFSMNLFGSSLEATIDVWAARYLRRKLYAGQVKQWRIQPKSETGVSNGDFLLGQEIFRRAANKLGMNPDDLQALMWFKEKDVWDNADWTKGAGAIKTSFDQAADAFFPPKQTIGKKQMAKANREGLSSINFIRKRRGVEGKAAKLEALVGQTGAKVTKAKRELRNAKKELTKSRKRAGVAEFLERNPELN